MQPNTQCFVYILTNTTDDTFYIGSTCLPLDIRFRYHTGELKNPYRPIWRSSRLYTHYDKLGWDNVKISLLETIICNNFRELHICETKYILHHLGTTTCLNMKVPFTYYNYRISKCTVLNSSTYEIYQRFIHSYKLDKVLKEYMKMVKIYPTDYIYGRAQYLFQFVLEEFMMFVDFIPPTCSAESTAIPPDTPPPKKRGRPKKIPPPEPSGPIPPKKRGRPKKTKDVPPEPLEKPSQPSPEIQPDPSPEIPQPEAPTPPKSTKIRPKFSKKISKINADSVVPLTSFIPANSV